MLESVCLGTGEGRRWGTELEACGMYGRGLKEVEEGVKKSRSGAAVKRRLRTRFVVAHAGRVVG